MKQQPHIDYDGLAAYISGELSETDRQKWAEWIAESSENEQVYVECLRLFEPQQPLEISDANTYDSRAAWDKIAPRMETVTRPLYPEKPEASPVKWWRVAAVILMAGALLTYLIRLASIDVVKIQQDSGIAAYVLPDSSVVTLNGEASIVYNEKFDKEHRTIELTGKGYFDVQRNESLVFEVVTGRGSLQVLGTAFLIEETSDSLYVVVDRGRVSVGLRETDERIELTKNEMTIIQFSGGNFTQKQVPSTNTLYWAHRKLSYRQSYLTEVFDELSDIFDKDIRYDAAILGDCKITAIFRDQSFEEIMENISISFPLTYTIEGDRIEIESDGCSNR